MFEVFALIILAAIFWQLYKLRFSSQEPISKKPIPGDVYEWPDTGDFHFNIVGESYYQSAIKRLAGPNNEHVEEKEYKALLVPEDDNPHDDKAVRVDIEGRAVGHLSREDARRFRRRLVSKKIKGQVTACKAIVTGGQAWDGNESRYGICLSIKEFRW